MAEIVNEKIVDAREEENEKIVEKDSTEEEETEETDKNFSIFERILAAIR